MAEFYYTKEGDIQTFDLGKGPFSKLVVDPAKLPEDQRSGGAKQLLAAAALSCYTQALQVALESRGAKYTNFKSKINMDLGSNDLGQSRVKKITIETRLDLPEEDHEIFERVEKIMKQGCIVVSSLKDGISVDYDLQANFEE